MWSEWYSETTWKSSCSATGRSSSSTVSASASSRNTAQTLSSPSSPTETNRCRQLSTFEPSKSSGFDATRLTTDVLCACIDSGNAYRLANTTSICRKSIVITSYQIIMYWAMTKTCFKRREKQHLSNIFLSPPFIFLSFHLSLIPCLLSNPFPYHLLYLHEAAIGSLSD